MDTKCAIFVDYFKRMKDVVHTCLLMSVLEHGNDMLKVRVSHPLFSGDFLSKLYNIKTPTQFSFLFPNLLICSFTEDMNDLKYAENEVFGGLAKPFAIIF